MEDVKSYVMRVARKYMDEVFENIRRNIRLRGINEAELYSLISEQHHLWERISAKTWNEVLSNPRFEGVTREYLERSTDEALKPLCSEFITLFIWMRRGVDLSPEKIEELREEADRRWSEIKEKIYETVSYQLREAPQKFVEAALSGALSREREFYTLFYSLELRKIED